MTSPRKIARIRHKAARLVRREGYGEQAPSGQRKTPKKDYGPVLADSPSPCDKKPHSTLKSANQHIAALRRKGDPDADHLDAYECPDCQFIHVGHSRRSSLSRDQDERGNQKVTTDGASDAT